MNIISEKIIRYATLAAITYRRFFTRVTLIRLISIYTLTGTEGKNEWNRNYMRCIRISIM